MSQDAPVISQEVFEKLPPEVQTLIAYLLAENAELRRRLSELESAPQAKTTPQNSSQPPSTVHPHAKPKPPRKPSGRKQGGQPGHPKAERPLIPSDQCQQVCELRPPSCRHCGEGLSGNDPDPVRHQVWELPKIEPLVTEYQRHRLSCPCCRKSTIAELPPGVPQGGSGPELIAFVALLMAHFRQSKRRAALFVETVLKIPCSAALTVKHQNIATEALRANYEELEQAVQRSPAVNFDETATKEGNQKAWLWVAATAAFTLFAVRLTRAGAVAKDLLSDFRGVITTDRYSGYDWCKRRQLCWAHLMRDFQWLIDRGGEAARIGTKLQQVGVELFRHWHDYRGGSIDRETMRHRIAALKWQVYEALEEGTLVLNGKAAGMCRHMLERYDMMWTFLDHEGVEPTNNAGERALRHAVIWRKLSFGTQSASGSRFVETMLSVIETCRQQDHDVLQFVTNAVKAHFAGQPAPSILTGA